MADTFNSSEDNGEMTHDDYLARAEQEYWEAIQDEYTEYTTVTLPDGRRVDARCETEREGLMSYFDPETLELSWHNGDELTHEELHIEIDNMYLHEWVLEHWSNNK